MAPLQIEQITIRRLKLTLKQPFTTSFGTFQDKEFLVLEARDENGGTGWGESVAFNSPWYNEETVETNRHILTKFLIPEVLKNPVNHPDDLSDRFSHIRRNYMAKSAIEGAVWDLFAKTNGQPLSKALGGSRSDIDVGISIGIKPSVKDLLNTIEKALSDGYKRIKVKIKPGWDVDVIKTIRDHYPDIPLMADANSAYSLADVTHLKKLDAFNLMMIEQPLAHDDIINHAELQSQLDTPVCLDESIHSLDDVKKSVRLQSCRIINIKTGRVGGLTQAKAIHDFCAENGIKVWCGGMLESGVGRAHNVALTTLGGFVLPGDTASSANYWARDIIQPEVVAKNGTIQVPDSPGIGYDIDLEAVEHFQVGKEVFGRKGAYYDIKREEK